MLLFFWAQTCSTQFSTPLIRLPPLTRHTNFKMTSARDLPLKIQLFEITCSATVLVIWQLQDTTNSFPLLKSVNHALPMISQDITFSCFMFDCRWLAFEGLVCTCSRLRQRRRHWTNAGTALNQHSWRLMAAGG